MFTRKNFYSYLHHQYSQQGELFRMYLFDPDGTRDFKDIRPWKANRNNTPERYVGNIALFDSEPINIDYWRHWWEYDPKDLPSKWFEYQIKHPAYFKSQAQDDFIFRHFSGVYTPILAHSETNSSDVQYFEDNFFHSVYYFYHGLIAREWFRHWKHYNMRRGDNAKRFGLYARDGSGSRAYRLDLINKLAPYNKDVHFLLQNTIAEQLGDEAQQNWPRNDNVITADHSSRIDVDDCERFDIHLVAETLFDTQKTHLTEKTFKPVVMRQPFIIVGPPHSLQCLRDYGFRTFDGLWDENYDKETDANRRMQRIMDVVEYLTSLNPAAFDRVMDRAQRIVDHNHRHFYSHEFEDQILLEIQNNFNSAFQVRNEQFYTMPGGTWFHYQQKQLDNGVKPLKFAKTMNTNIIEYLANNGEETVAKQILKKYPGLI